MSRPPGMDARGLVECIQMKLILLLSGLALGTLLGVGCSEAPPPPAAKKEPPKPPEPISGQSALFKMYQKARTWSTDAQVLMMNSIQVPEVPQVIGKAGAWQASFTSAALGKKVTYTYSVVEQEGNLHQGVFSTGEEAWSGKQGVNSAFDIRGVSVDSDAAYKTADEQAKDYDQKHPNMPISFLLEKIDQFNLPVWRVIWGESVGTSSFSVYIDASLGQFMGKMH